MSGVTFDLSGTKVLIVGGGSGIGLATALMARDSGAQVWVFDRANDRLAGERGIRTTRFDLADASATAAATDEVLEVWGACDLVHLNAGIADNRTFTQSREEDLLAILEVNLFAAWRIAHALLPAMLAAGSGVVAFTGSPHAKRSTADASSYAVSKAAVSALMRSIALEAAPHGVRAVSVLPGAIVTPLLLADARDHSDGDGDDVIARWSAQRPIGRLGAAEEIASAVLFLASGASGFTTGAELIVDGGMFAAMPS
jgi:NAD(P)-dependent dehydrogenase (short-subunit alcohol dehydrogenase family)